MIAREGCAGGVHHQLVAAGIDLHPAHVREVMRDRFMHEAAVPLPVGIRLGPEQNAGAPRAPCW